jgi:AraC-like DNA-binding protein
MLSEGLDATRAGSRVGYRDASHFTREYKRLFGAPPMHDVDRLRQGTGSSPVSERIGAGMDRHR